MRRLIKNSKLPIITDQYETLNYDYIELGIQQVPVKDIVGLSDGRVEEYNDDWMPKDENDSRWQYVYNAYKNNNQLPPIPLLKTPDGTYYANGDGNHRISAAKTLGLDYVDGEVTIMVPKDVKINEKWEEYSKEKQKQLDNLSNKYKKMLIEFNKIQDDAFENNDFIEYNKFNKKMDELVQEMNIIEKDLLNEEKQFKQKLLDQYLNN